MHWQWREHALFREVARGVAAVENKLGAMRLGLPRAPEWGTHCFRRGRSDEVLREGAASGARRANAARVVAEVAPLRYSRKAGCRFRLRVGEDNQ